MSQLFIGMPVYNGTRFIAEAIESLINQTYTDWTLLISDNASDDDTAIICQQYSNTDKRIAYYRQMQNIGAPANYYFLLSNANTEYFMWAATDDIWDREFLNSCITNLEQNPKYGFAFSNINNIDSFGRKIRDYPSLSRFASQNRFDNIHNFLNDPEIMGKANLIYSVYRLKLCQLMWSINPFNTGWGSDMCFVLTALARSYLAIDERVLFHKRLTRPTDCADAIDPILIENPESFIFPLHKADEYIQNTLKAVEGTEFYEFAKNIMEKRKEQLF